MLRSSRTLLLRPTPLRRQFSEWRKQQLDKLERKFSSPEITNDEDLQPLWQDMERRVARRRPRENGPKGRKNVRKTDEEQWLAAGLYDDEPKK